MSPLGQRIAETMRERASKSVLAVIYFDAENRVVGTGTVNDDFSEQGLVDVVRDILPDNAVIGCVYRERDVCISEVRRRETELPLSETGPFLIKSDAGYWCGTAWTENINLACEWPDREAANFSLHLISVGMPSARLAVA